MRTTLRRVVTAGALLTLLAPMAARADTTRDATATYYGGTVLSFETTCEAQVSDDPNIGGACFEVDDFENQVDISIDDLSPLPAAADYYFWDGAGNLLTGIEPFCDAVSVPVPLGAIQLVVAMDYASIPSCDSGGVPTTGTITATFHTPDEAG